MEYLRLDQVVELRWLDSKEESAVIESSLDKSALSKNNLEERVLVSAYNEIAAVPSLLSWIQVSEVIL